MKKISKTYREKTSKELIKESQLLREEIAKLQLSLRSNPPKDSNALTKKKKQLAVLLTIFTEKQEIESLQKKADKPIKSTTK